MRVLFCGPTDSPLVHFLKQSGDVEAVEERLTSSIAQGFDYLVSYGYRYLVTSDVLKMFPKKAINLHVSYLPWNRGADPNLWSFIEGTPKGVTLHFMDAGLDTGEIISQQLVEMDENDTLATSYEKLQLSIQDLFMKTWRDIVAGRIRAFPQPMGGTFHKKSDKDSVLHLLKKGWETPVKELTGQSPVNRNNVPSSCSGPNF